MRPVSLLLALALLAGCAQHASEGDDDAKSPIAPVQSAKVIQTQVQERLSAPGTVVPLPDRTGTVVPAAAMRVLALHVRQGERVAAGQEIATLLQDPSVEADLAKARVTAGQASRERERQERLFAAGVTPRVRVEQTRADEAIALADLKARQAAYELARASSVLRAPLGGVVTQLTGSVGQMADTATPIATIADLSQVGIESEIPAPKLGKLRPGLPVSVRAPWGAALPGKLLSIEGGFNAATQRSKVTAVAANPGLKLQAAMFTTLEIDLGSHTGLEVPAKAIVPRAGGSVVYVLDGGVAHERPVTTAEAPDGSNVEVLKGLKAGEEVATQGAYELAEGMRVKVEQ